MSEPLIKLSFDSLKPSFHAAGFPLAGGVDYDLALPIYREHAKRYQDWIMAQKNGEMGYLQRGLDRRLDPTLVFPELKSVITVALPYSPHPVEKNGLKYARYLNGLDYHGTLKEKLESVFQNLREQKIISENVKYKICVDTSAVLERTWGAITGLGWIGKNTLLIHPQLGSYFFLGVVFTNLELGEPPRTLKDYCGECSRCISVCPTSALKPHDLDARTCISYLTLEKRGEWETSYPTKGFLAGCDLCQEVCPYNTKAVKNASLPEAANHLELSPENLLAETPFAYAARVKGTALSRVKFSDFQRNLQAALTQSASHK